MATRFYLSNNAGAVTPTTWNGGWTVTSDTENVGTKSCDTTKQNTSLVTSGAINAPGVSGNTSAVGRWISPALAAQTINSGTTLTGYLRCNQNTGTANVTLAIYVGLINSDGSAGSTIVALAASDNTSSTPPEMGTALASRAWLNASEASPTVPGNVSVTAGQRLVIEVGGRFATTTTSRNAVFRYGDPSAVSDFSSDNDTTNDYCSWVELSQTLTWQPIPVTRDPLVGLVRAVGAAPALALGVQLGLGALQLAGGAPTLEVGRTLLPGAGTVQVTGGAVDVLHAYARAPGAGAVQLTGGAVDALHAYERAPAAGTLQLAGQTPVRIVEGEAEATFTVELREGATVRATRVVAHTASFADYAYELTAPEVAAITDWSALRVALIADGAQVEVSWLRLDTPAGTGAVTKVPGVGSVVLAGAQPTALHAYARAPDAGAVVLEGAAPTLTQAILRTPDVGLLVFAGASPTLVGEGAITPDRGVLQVVGAAPTAQHDRFARPDAGALVVTGAAPTAPQTVPRAPDVGALVLTGAAPTLFRTYTATPAAGLLQLAGATPTILGAGALEPETATLVVTGGAVTVLHAHLKSPAVGAVQFAGAAPTRLVTLTRAPGPGTLVLQGAQPTLGRTYVALPAAGTLILAGGQPTLVGEGAIAPAGGTLVLTGGAVRVGHGIGVPAGTVVLAGTVSSLGRTYVGLPAVGTVVLAGAVPVVVVTPPITSVAEAAQTWTVEAAVTWDVPGVATWTVLAAKTWRIAA